jgi:methionyl-tRNA formyltransferase
MGSPPPPPLSEFDRPLRIVYMGTPAMAAYILERLIADPSRHFEVVGVVTRPDSARNRGMRMESSEVGALAEHHGLPVLRPRKIRTSEFFNELKAFAPDLLIVVAYGRILPREVLEIPRIMPLNVHASLLPRLRGAAPVEGAILAGEHETGVTIMRVTEQMDAGPMLLQRKIPLDPNETQATLKTKLAKLGSEALLEGLSLLRSEKLEEVPQDEKLATYTSPITKEQGIIDWSMAAVEIERMVRAFDPWPTARTRLAAEDLLIWKAAVMNPAQASPVAATDAVPGTLVSMKPAPTVKCGSGLLVLLEVQAPGRRRMPAADFMRGRRLTSGTVLGS